MTNSDSSKENTDSLSDTKNDETSEILKSIESFEDVYEMRRSKSTQEINNNNSEEDNQPSCSTSKPEVHKSEADTDSLYTSSVKHMSVRYSSSTYRMDSGEVRQPNGQQMEYHDYSYSQYPVCTGSCCWQPSARNGQDYNSGVPYGRDQMTPEMSNYSYGHATHSASDETIVNETRPSTSAAAENLRCSSNSCSFCCPMRQPGQQQTSACYACDGGNPSQEQMIHMPMPPMVVDPSTGYPFYSYPAPGSYPGMGMCSMPAMEMEQPQRSGGGQHSAEVSTPSCSGSQSPAMGCGSPSMEGGANNQNPSNFDMEEFMHKYQKSLQQCYATAQQGLHQSFANVNGHPYFNQSSQGNQQYYAHSNQGTPSQMFAGSNQATPQYYDNTNQEAQPSLAYQRMQPAFSSHLNPQQYYATSSLGAQSYLAPPISIPASSFFGNNSGFISDTLHTQTVYSSDYKSFGNGGNHFNHFPNGIDIGLTSESTPGYGPARSSVLAEMGVGGQVYGLGGASEMNMSSYPLSQMGYSTPYPYEMPSASSGHHGMGMANGGIPM